MTPSTTPTERDQHEHPTPDATQSRFVWVNTSANGSPATVYHTNPDCRALSKAANTVRKPRDVLADDLPECKLCSGRMAPHKATTDPQALRRKLLAATPEQFGLPAHPGGDSR